jgi:hypothetical protein
MRVNGLGQVPLSRLHNTDSRSFFRKARAVRLGTDATGHMIQHYSSQKVAAG